MPPILYFYGLAGAGKNFVGDIAGRLTGRPVYHADADLTPEMRQAIAEKHPFTPDMRDRYYAIVANRILERGGPLVVTQATYKIRHRDYLASRIDGLDMICVTADEAVIVQRLRDRGDAVTPEYAAALKAGFEPPPAGSKTIINNGGEQDVIRQLDAFYGQGHAA